MLKLIFRFFWYLCLLVLTGCGQSETPLAPVSGTVYYNGQPLRDGAIVFIPNEEKGNHGPLSIAKIQSDGTYQIRTANKKGAVPGWHRVTISSPLSRVDSRLRIPAHFADPDRSDQACEVKSGQTNQIDFHLR